VAFETRWRATSPALRVAIQTLAKDILAHEATTGLRQRRRRPADARRFTRALGAIVCNLAAVNSTAPGLPLAVRRDPAARRHVPLFGRTFTQLLDIGEAMGLWTATRGFRLSATARALSTVTATARLLTYLPAGQMPDYQRPFHEGILMRGTKDADGAADILPIPETEQSRAPARAMAVINEWLASLPVTKAGPQAWLVPTPCRRMQRIVTTQRVELTRIFNNGRLDHGGRLFGGWWQNMERDQRRTGITIAGERVVEADYNAMFLRLAYCWAGVRWPFPADADPYIAIPGTPRDPWKTLTNAMLFSSARLRGWPGDSTEEREELRLAFGGMPLSDARSAIMARHEALAVGSAFERGIGHELANMESNLLVTTLLVACNFGMPALPIHDCLIVRRSDAEKAAGIMESVAETYLGQPFPVVVKE
jgi:hypothetical protein